MPHLLITGGAKRIGASVARYFAGLGFKITVHYRNSSAAAQALANELNATRGCCAIVQGDLAQRDRIDEVFHTARQAFGPVNLLVNNASAFHNDDVPDLEDSVFDDHLAINLKAPVFLSGLVAAQTDADDMLIVNMLDNKLFALNPDFLTYTISKGALMTATHMLAMRFDGQPRVCGIAPSIVLISGKQTQANFEKSARINPLNRRVDPDDIARCLEYLWSEKSVNNQIVTLDGGQSLLSLPRDVAFLVKEGKLDGDV